MATQQQQVRTVSPELVQLIRTRFKSIFAKSSQAFELLFAQPESERVDFLADMLRLWCVPFKPDLANSEPNPFTDEQLEHAVNRFKELENGKQIKSCELFQNSLQAKDVAARIYNDLLFLQRFGKAEQVVLLAHALEKHTPYADYKFNFEPNTVGALEAYYGSVVDNNPELFAEFDCMVQAVMKEETDLMLAVVNWLVEKLTAISDEGLRRSILCYAIGITAPLLAGGTPNVVAIGIVPSALDEMLGVMRSAHGSSRKGHN